MRKITHTLAAPTLFLLVALVPVGVTAQDKYMLNFNDVSRAGMFRATNINGMAKSAATLSDDAESGTVTVGIDNVANINYIKLGNDNITSQFSNGTNTVAFTAETGNTISLMTKGGLDNSEVEVRLNGETISPDLAGSYGVMYNNITIANGDRLDIKTEQEKGGDDQPGDNDLPSNKSITEIIKSVPAGGRSTQLYGKSVTFNMEGGINQLPTDGFAGKITFYDNGDVYMQTPIALDNDMDAYLKGTYADGIITIPLPQKIYCEDWGWQYGTIEEWAARLDFVVTDETTKAGTFKALKDKYDEIKFGYDESTGIIKAYNPDDELFILGTVDENNKWTGFGDMNIELTTHDETAETIAVPATATIEKWLFKNVDRFINVATDGTDIYVQGLFYYANPDYWVKGTVTDGKATFPSVQYLGIYKGWYSYFWAIGTPDGNIPKDKDRLSALVFDYDTAAKSLKARANEGFMFNAGKGVTFPIDRIMAPEIAYEDIATDVTPQAPYNLQTEGGDGEIAFGFYLPIKTADNKKIDVNNMSYKLWVSDGADEEPYIFYSDDYNSLDEDTDEISFNFLDGWDFYGLATDDQGNPGRSMYLYIGSYSDLGVQSIYTCEDGRKTYSPITWLSGRATDGIATVTSAGNGIIVSTQYYDLGGCPVAAPTAGGVYIKRSTFADGSTRTTKELK